MESHQYSSSIGTEDEYNIEKDAHNKTLNFDILPKYYANACQRMESKIPGYSDIEYSKIKY